MLAKPLAKGDTIGFASPSSLVTREAVTPIIAALEGMGYRVKAANNLYANGWGYAASDQERADDLNQLIRDDTVSMIFFSGGEGADDLLPLMDFDAAKAHPKLWLSYSDGTTILDAVWAKTGLITYYGQMPGLMIDPSEYNLGHFQRAIECGKPDAHVPNSPWHTLRGGEASGILIGGYLDNFIFLCNNGWVMPKPCEKYILFIEDHEKFFSIEHESALLRRLELSPIMTQTAGLLFGHYSDPVNHQLLQRLTLLANRHSIPVCYCDDFGHGQNHAILPIGARATLNADKQTLKYAW